ncbi:MAG: hypothetical protein KGN33_05245 [Paracoccaceae bacterium]|nr:hypothetical protein [Paracoccaceae bacterium]
MQTKPLDQAEQDLLAVIVTLHAERGAMGRDVLSVAARGRGLEVSRPLSALIAQGFVAEITRRPFFLFRLFGAKAQTRLQPTEAGRAALAGTGAPPAQPESEAPADAAAGGAKAAPAAPPAPAAPATEPGTDTPAATAAPVSGAAPAAGPTPEPQAPAPAIEAAPEPQPEPAPAPAPAAKPRPKSPPRARIPVDAFTEDLGGTAIDDEAAPRRAAVQPEVLEGLREMLSVVGLDLTDAGQILIADRLSKGARPGEAMSQVTLFAFAHAVRNDLMTYGSITALGLTDYAVEVMREIEKLRDAGEIADEVFEADMRRLWALLQDTPERATLLEDLLLDPIGGLAPPAVLPEDLRQVEDLPDDGF